MYQQVYNVTSAKSALLREAVGFWRLWDLEHDVFETLHSVLSRTLVRGLHVAIPLTSLNHY